MSFQRSADLDTGWKEMAKRFQADMGFDACFRAGHDMGTNREEVADHIIEMLHSGDAKKRNDARKALLRIISLASIAMAELVERMCEDPETLT